MPVVHRRRLLSVIAAALPLLAAATASAQAPARPFGARGQVVVEDLVAVRSSGMGFLGVLTSASSSFGPVAPPAFSGLVGYERYETKVPVANGLVITVNTVSVAPSLDVFVANRVSLGLTAGFAYGWGGQQMPAEGGAVSERGTAYTFGIAPRVGYVVPLGAGFSLWPRLGAGFTLSRADTAYVSPGQPARPTSLTGGYRVSGGLDLGVVFRPTRNIFFSATPELSVAYSAYGQRIEDTTVYDGQGVRVRFGGTLGFGVLLGT
jgi:hypothetical protein